MAGCITYWMRSSSELRVGDMWRLLPAIFGRGRVGHNWAIEPTELLGKGSSLRPTRGRQTPQTGTLLRHQLNRSVGKAMFSRTCKTESWLWRKLLTGRTDALTRKAEKTLESPTVLRANQHPFNEISLDVIEGLMPKSQKPTIGHPAQSTHWKRLYWRLGQRWVWLMRPDGRTPPDQWRAWALWAGWLLMWRPGMPLSMGLKSRWLSNWTNELKTHAKLHRNAHTPIITPHGHTHTRL